MTYESGLLHSEGNRERAQQLTMGAPYHAPIKLIALDLDGTVFGDDLVVSQRMRDAIGDAKNAGLTVAIATGRMYRSARMIAEALRIEGPIICYQGAMVKDSTTGDVLLHGTIPKAFVHEVISETERLGLHLNIYLDDELFVSQTNRQAEFYTSINMGLNMNEVGDLHRWIDEQDGQPTKLVIVTDEEETDRVLRHFTEQFGSKMQVTKSHARFTELTNIACSKGRALAMLAQILGVPRESTMAIGDGLNDLDMILWAGLGVAMGTCPAPVREAALVVCPPLSEDGAALAIEIYALGRTPGVS